MKETRKKQLKYLGIVLLAILIVVQFFPIDKTAPEFDPSGDFIVVSNAPENIKSILKTSCYDCHSFETVYPWYSNIAPISWWIKDHVNEARKELNFNIWSEYTVRRADHKLEEMVEEVEEHEMPLNSYLIIHSEARLSDEQEQELFAFINQLRSTLDVPEED